MLVEDFDAAIVTINRAREKQIVQGNHFYEAEMNRVQGEILLRQSKTNSSEAERLFRHAIDIAKMQACRTIELRAAVSLAHVLRERGDAAEARSLLKPLYAGFTEGFSQLDLQAARSLLSELGE
jgi:predicted ATPase